MIKEELETKTKEELIDLLINERTKNEAIIYFKMDPTLLLKNLTSKELYDLLVKVKESSFIDKYIEYILENKKDYYLLLKENKEKHGLDTYISRYIEDILFKNDITIKIGNGEKIEVKEESVGFTSKMEHKTYTKGNIVILDVDTATYEEDFELEYYENLILDLYAYNEMEERYQKEKREKTFK